MTRVLLAAFLGAAAMYIAIFGWAWLGRDRPLEERGEPSWREYVRVDGV